MYNLDKLVVNFIIEQCEKMGQLFLADFMGINRFEMGVMIYIVIIGVLYSVTLKVGGKRVD